MKNKKSYNELLLPRPYLSWSQINLFLSSPEQYVKRYIYNEEQPETPEMRFGKEIAKVFEEQEELEDMVLETLRITIPRYEMPEYRIMTEIDGLKLFGILDSFQPHSCNIIEYKTGLAPWTQKRADEHGQLHFYALLCYLQYRRLPEKINLVWIETVREKGEISITGYTRNLSVKPDMKKVLNMMKTVDKVSREIDKIMRKEINKI